jgi:endogenous inhibitor of DNA gyrase (YacG/DUF329 family)
VPDNTPPPPADSKGTVQRIVQCPTCRKAVAWLESELFRPFCSRKCQLIDFGEWASERHSIPADPPEDDALDVEDDSAD